MWLQKSTDPCRKTQEIIWLSIFAQILYINIWKCIQFHFLGHARVTAYKPKYRDEIAVYRSANSIIIIMNNDVHQWICSFHLANGPGS